MAQDSAVDAKIAAAPAFAQPILVELRAALHEAEPALTEAIKWSRPFFLLDGRPFAFLAAFKAHCGFGFWQGPETGREGEAAGQFGKLTTLAELPARGELVALIRAQVAEARARHAAPSKPKTRRPDLPMPDDLAEALAAAPDAQATFAGFTSGQRRDYVEWVTEPKRAETRSRRIALTVERVAQGIRHNEKYRSG